MAEENRQRVGAHEVWTEHHDVFCVRLVGELAVSEAEQIIAIARQWMREEDSYFWLIDVTQLRHVAPEARKTLATASPAPGYRGSVSYGVGFTQRLLSTMLENVSKLARRHPTPSALFAAEEDARRYLEEARRQQRTHEPRSATA